MNQVDFTAAVGLVIVITLGVLLGRVAWSKMEARHVAPAPVTEPEAAQIVQSAPTSVEEFLDRYPNV